MKRRFIQFAALLFVAGCATETPSVSSHYDPVMGDRTDLLSGNILESSGPLREIVELDASRVWKNARDNNYYLEVSYMARSEVGYLEIPPGETLTIVADGQPLKFDGTGSANMRKRVRKEVVQERAIYPATRGALQKIARAQQV